jgi:hypothetical protein
VICKTLKGDVMVKEPPEEAGEGYAIWKTDSDMIKTGRAIGTGMSVRIAGEDQMGREIPRCREKNGSIFPPDLPKPDEISIELEGSRKIPHPEMGITDVSPGGNGLGGHPITIHRG